MGQSRAATLAKELSDLLELTGRKFVIAYESTHPEREPSQFRVWNSNCETECDAEELHNLWLNAEELLFEHSEEVS